MTEMRILTVRNPWAWAIIWRGKDVENRVRNVAGDYRGPIAIHAAKTVDADAPKSLWGDFHDAGHEAFGAIIGVVDLVDVHFGPFAERWDAEAEHNARCTPWAESDMFHLVLANPRPLSELLPYRGALGLRRLPDDVADAVRKAVA